MDYAEAIRHAGSSGSSYEPNAAATQAYYMLALARYNLQNEEEAKALRPAKIAVERAEVAARSRGSSCWSPLYFEEKRTTRERRQRTSSSCSIRFPQPEAELLGDSCRADLLRARPTSSTR